MTYPSVTESLKKDGYAIFRGALTPEQIAKLRRDSEACLKDPKLRGQVIFSMLGKSIPWYADQNRLNWVMHAPNVLATLRKALGTDEIYMLMDSAVLKNRLSGWHGDFGSPRFKEYCRGKTDCCIYQVGIYLQDHSFDPRKPDAFGGLKVRKGSNLSDPNSDQIVPLEVKAGDLAMWDIRTLHSGQIADPVERLMRRVVNRFFKRELPIEYFIKNLYWKLVGKPNRYLVSFTVGLPNEYSKRYAEMMFVKSVPARKINKYAITDELRAELEKKGVGYFFSEERGEYQIDGNAVITPSGKRYVPPMI